MRLIRTRSTGTDLLVRAWLCLASGNETGAREKMLIVWSGFIDGLEGEQATRVALRLLERLAPATDDPDTWASLPEEFVVYRAGPEEGFSWTTDRSVAQDLARSHDLKPIRSGRVAKRDVLAFITGRGESEIVVRPERVTRT